MFIKLLTKLISCDRNNSNFSIDVLITYLLHDCAEDVVLCCKFDNAAKFLLTKEEFPCEYTREEIQA